jgi:hypothetical protein
MIMFGGGFGVRSVESADSVIDVRVGSFGGESVGSKFDLKTLHPIYSSCYSTSGFALLLVCHFTKCLLNYYS